MSKRSWVRAARRAIFGSGRVAGRDSASAINSRNLKSIQAGTLRYSWRGVPCLKNPFDFALYPLLLWQLKPKTIIEIGSNAGGSALWLADTMRALGQACEIVSIDIKAPAVSDAQVRFLVGDAHNLDAVLTADMLAGFRRPWLVIEDSSHQYATCMRVLKFFDRYLAPGEYILIEDGIVDDLGLGDDFDGGPNRAIKEFLVAAGERYAIDPQFCDFYGHNVTWNTNGYLRRIS